MRAERKQARDFVKSIKTKAELDAYLNILNITEEEKDIARMLFCKGYSVIQVSIATGYSEHQVRRKINRIYDRMI